MKDALLKDTFRSIRRNRLRFLSVVIIVALGISFYIGIKSASPKMNSTANRYFTQYNLLDVRVASKIPFTDEDINKISELENVDSVVKSRYVDAIVRVGKTSVVDSDGMELSCRVSEFDCVAAKEFTQSGNAHESYINRLELVEGRYPEKTNECVVDSRAVKMYDEIQIGSVLSLNGDGASVTDSLVSDELTVVGTVDSPMYISADRGTTQVGSGSLSTFAYVDSQSFSTNDYNELFIRIPDSEGYDKFSPQYRDIVTNLSDEIKEMSSDIIASKLVDVKADYNSKISDKEAEIKAYEASSAKEIADKQKEINDCKAYVDSEDDLLKAEQEKSEEAKKSAKVSLDSAKKSFDSISKTYNENYKQFDGQSQQISGYSELKKLYDDLNKKHGEDKTALNALEKTRNAEKADYDKAKSEYDKAKSTLKKNEDKIADLKASNTKLESEIASLESDKTTQSKKVETLKYDIKDLQSKIDAINAKIEAGTADASDYVNLSSYNRNLLNKNSDLKTAQSALSSTESKISSKKSEISKNKSNIDNLNNSLPSFKNVVSTAENALSTATSSYNIAKNNYDTAKLSYDADSATLAKYKESMNNLTSGTDFSKLQQTVEQQKNQFEAAKVSLTVAQIRYSLAVRNGDVKVNQAQTKLNDAKERYYTIDDELTELKEEIDIRLSNLNGDLKMLKNTLKNVESIEWNTTGQTDFSGHDSFISSMENINSMSTIFPLIFLFTAMVACFIIMLKNVEDERNSIGLFKAFGYSNLSVVCKYLVYSTSAWVLGAAVGIAIGSCVLPGAVYSIYGSTFNIPDINIAFNMKYIIRGMAVSFVTTTAASIFAASRELKNYPSVIMRPKTIMYNRRAFIERFPNIWTKLPYGIVLLARTVSRSRKRVIVGTVTIACCTALVLSALGLLNSATDVKSAQYSKDGIFCYDMQFVLNAGQEPDDSVTLNALDENRNVESSLLVANIGYDVSAVPSRWRGLDSAHIIVPSKTDELKKYVNFNMVDGSADIENGGVIITEKMASDLEISVGDTAYFTNTDGDIYSAVVSGITRNHINHYVYMSPQTYKDTFFDNPNYKYILSILKDYLTDSEIATLSSDFVKTDEVTGAVSSKALAQSVDISINQVLALVILFVAAAFVLASIVMYTISNVNISERNHEIANIKVIGFSDGELLIYVIRENIFATVIGILFGLVGGILLNRALVNYISVENVMYGHHIFWWSYFAAMLIIVLVGFVASLPILFKINRVNMPETLKSIE